MRLVTALLLSLTLGLSLPACDTKSKDEGTLDAASGGTGGQASGSISRSSTSTEKADAAVKGTGGSVAPDAGNSGSAGRDGGVATGTGGASVQGGAGGSTSAGAGDDGGVASGGMGGSSSQGGSGDAGAAGAGGNPGGASGSSSSSGRSGGASCDCVGTEIECLCKNQGYYCKANVSDFTSGATQYNTLVEYADCKVSVVETGGSGGREILIYDQTTGTLVGRRHYSDIIEPCSGSNVLGGGKWPDSTCKKSKCTASRPTGGKLGDLITTDMVSVGISVQRDEPISSAGGPWDRWMVEVAGRAVTLNNKAAGTASEAQIQALVTLVHGIDYRFRDVCCGGITMRVDGPPHPSSLTVNGKEALLLIFEVGDTDDCAHSSLNATGRVINCSAFAPLYDLIEEMGPSGGKFTCSKNW